MNMTCVLGVDPGVEYCGLAMLTSDGPHWFAREVATVRTAAKTGLHARMAQIHHRIADMLDSLFWQDGSGAIRASNVYIIACESQDRAFEGHRSRGTTNADALRVQQVVGIVRAQSFRPGIDFVEVEPQEAKIAVLGKGSGSADKGQVERAVRALVKDLPSQMTSHASDACAIAIAGARKFRVDAQLRRAG